MGVRRAKRRWGSMSERVTIFDIAKEAGVSIATVSRVMAGSDKVRPGTRDRVLHIINKHNFKPSMIASGLSKRKSHTIGLVVPPTDNPYYTKLCMAVQREAQRADHSLQLYQIARGTMITQSFVDLLIGKRMDGLILSGDIASEANDQAVMDLVRQVKPYMPLLMIMPLWRHEECMCLASDLDAGMRMALRHLMRLGHERIAMVGGTGLTANPDTREHAYMDELTGRGLAMYPLMCGDTAADGELGVLRLLGAPGGTRPTALVCFNDLVAMGVLRQLRKLGVRVPEEMAVVGCDNLFFAGYLEPPLTTVDWGIEETARLGVRLLVSGEVDGTVRKTFEPTLVVRESCGANLNPL